MQETTLAYISKGGRTLMLHRVRKRGDVNAGKWIGIGGKLEPGETPDECMLREVLEETGLTPTRWAYRAVVDFESDTWSERMHLYTVTDFTGSVGECDEGDLAWVADSDVPSLPAWEGDRIFLRLLARGEPFFHLLLRYRGEDLAGAELNGRPLDPAGDCAAGPFML